MNHNFYKPFYTIISMKKVKKVWGEEHWIVNQDYCGKKLILKKNYRCSLHHHKKKDEVFYVIKGKVLLEANNKNMILLPGDSFHVKQYCNHRFTGLQNSEIIEFSSHHEDEDSYRLEVSGKIEGCDEDKYLEIIDNFKNKKVLVIGDIMLDKYLEGDVEKISPEAPVQVVNITNQKNMLGGAANVCNNLAQTGAKTYLAGIIGKDNPGRIIIGLLKNQKIDSSLIIEDKNRETTLKTRIIGRHQQLIRLDHEVTEKINQSITSKITKNIISKIKDFDAIIIADYAKGVVTENLMNLIITQTNKHKIPLLLDPKPTNSQFYKNVFLIKPNKKEAIEMSGINIKEEKDIIKAGKIMVKKFNSNIMLTCGDKGMYTFEKDGTVHSLPTEAKDVFDVTGAGDTVAAFVGLSLASKSNLKEAAFIANKAAGIVVGKMGTSTVGIEELKQSIEDE
jgi:D-glycero-beta-D-manno-heptose-7-phosphate kinase